jgi:hypothetical protein
MPQSHRLSQHSGIAPDHKVYAFGVNKIVDNQCLLHLMVESDAVLVCVHRNTSKMMRNTPINCLALT